MAVPILKELSTEHAYFTQHESCAQRETTNVADEDCWSQLSRALGFRETSVTEIVFELPFDTCMVQASADFIE